MAEAGPPSPQSPQAPPETPGWPTGTTPDWTRPPEHPPEVHRPVSTDRRLAGLALGLSFVPCGWNVLVAVPVAVVALARIHQGRAAGPRLAIAALVICSAWGVFYAYGAVSALLADAPRDETGRVTQPSEVSVYDLRDGDCVELPGKGRQLLSVTVVPCSRAHDLEAYDSFDLPAGDYPGNRAVGRSAELGCLARFKEFVGIAPARSELGLVSLHPLEDGWTFRDDREVTCLLEGADGDPLRGSLRDSRA